MAALQHTRSIPIFQQFARDDPKHGGKTLNQRASSRNDKARKSIIIEPRGNAR